MNIQQVTKQECQMCEAYASEHVAPYCPKHLQDLYDTHDCNSYGRDSGQHCEGCRIFYKYAWITQKPMEAVL